PSQTENLDLLGILESGDPLKIDVALNSPQNWEPRHLPSLLRLLPRDLFYPRASEILAGMGDASLPLLAESLADENCDFVIRRRVPRILADLPNPQAATSLLKALRTDRFEIRFRSAIALVKRRRKELPMPEDDWKGQVWDALSFELGRDRAVWEMQRIIDKLDEAERDSLAGEKVESRGQLSLEHAFRLLSLVLDPTPVKTSYQGILLGDEKLKSFSLEYLEHVLPRPIHDKLWPFIGDLSEAQQQKKLRPVNQVVEDLLKTGATLFSDEISRETLRQAIEELKKKP